MIKQFTGSIVVLKDNMNIRRRKNLASDLFEAVEHALEYATKRDILYLDLGHAG